VFTTEIEAQVMAHIIRPTLAEMSRRGTPYRGVLYAGLMIADGQARLVEYNARFGDPECQVLMLRLGAQALDLIQACAEGRLAEVRPVWAADHALAVVMAARGYPSTYAKGSEIIGLDAIPETPSEVVFHAGTTFSEGRVTATGGRVLNAAARAPSLAAAREKAYALVDRIDWPDGFCRRDIGWRAL
jgi:phosphoribosylamine--glycine ligase